LLQILGERGLEHVSVREVAAGAGVSIGTVQHYFPTKEQMLTGAFEEVVRRVHARVASVTLGPDVHANLSAVLRELLPLDERRGVEARVQLAFALRAATAPALAEIQRGVLADIHQALAGAFARAWGEPASPERCRRAARLTLAATDGLALHFVSAAGLISPRQVETTLELLLDTLLGSGRPAA
jgi:AcrR family transcriptional regulator